MRNLAEIWASIAGYKIDPDMLDAYRTAIPSTINLRIEHKKNHYIAEIKSIENEKLPRDIVLITEAQSDKELIHMVNDLILTYKNIPELYRPYFKSILSPSDSVKQTRKEELTLVKA
jgi:hypothetical protein